MFHAHPDIIVPIYERAKPVYKIHALNNVSHWYTMRGFCHTILISSYTSNSWGTEDLRLWSVAESVYSHTMLFRNTVKIMA